MDKLKDKLKTAAIVLAAVDGGKVQLAAGVTADSIGKVKAGELVNFVAQQVGGKGGGKPDMAMAGGTDPSKLPARCSRCRRGWPSGLDAGPKSPGPCHGGLDDLRSRYCGLDPPSSKRLIPHQVLDQACPELVEAVRDDGFGFGSWFFRRFTGCCRRCSA